jgi:hypothetical protein
MAKNFLNDIRPAGQEERRGRPKRIEDEPLQESTRPVQLPPRFREKTFQHAQPRRSRRTLWIIVVLVILGGLIAVANFFSSAKVQITPKSEGITLENSLFNATLAGDAETLSFQLVKLTGSAEKVVTGGTPTTVLTKATGKVVIYNNFSKTPQKLAIDTRLATSDGKIYKTDVALTVPGFKTEGGKQVPGSIEVGVHADLAGPTYNIPLSDFTIVGFKGTPKYDKFYARSKTVMSGGASGQGIALSEADSKIAREAALAILRDKLVAETKASLPDEAILLPGAYVIREDADSGQTVADKNVMIVKGSMYGILFNEKDLAKKIAEVSVSQFDGAAVDVPEIESFTIDIKNKDTLTDTTSTVSFTISGSGKVVWQIPTTEIVTKLLGSKKREVGQNLSAFPSVEKASVKVFPFWSLRLPKDAASVEVNVD